MISKRWLRPLLIAGIITLLLALYVGIAKSGSPRGYRIELSNTLFLWGLSLLVISSVYVTKFFGYMHYFQKWFRPRTYQELQETGTDNAGEADEEKRDPSLIYASLLLLATSILITL